MHLSIITALALVAGPGSASDVGPLVRALWLVQRYGTADAADPMNNQWIKGALFKALGKDGEITLSELDGIMEPETFKKLAGPDDRISLDEIREAVETAVPESQNRLLPKVRQHADLLTTSYDMIGETHRLAGRKLVDWIAKNYRPGKPLDVVVVCTGNSRRSILGATMGNIAAAYYGMPEVRFHSGGTAPTAFNARTVKTLKEIGVEVEPTGKDAARVSRIPRIRYIASAGDRPAERASRRWKQRSFPSITAIPRIPSIALPPSWSAARPMPLARS